jgi:hypothetical protein
MININKFSVYEISEFINSGYKIARLENNRELDDKAVKAKMKSLKAKGQLQTAIVLPAQRAKDENLQVVDFLSGEGVKDEDIPSYLVLPEGNHRYKAHLNLLVENKDNEGKKDFKKYEGKFYVMLPLTDTLSIAEMMAEMNICTKVWKGTDYIRGAIMSHPENVTEVLRYMAELEQQKFSLPAISMYVTDSEKVNKSMLQKFMNGEVSDTLQDSEEHQELIDRSKKVLEAAKEFGDVLGTRSFADWIKSKLTSSKKLTGEQVTNRLVGFFNWLSKDQITSICNSKGKRGITTKEDVINYQLNKLFDVYVQDIEKKVA